MRIVLVLLATLLLGPSFAHADERLRLFAAGSLTDAMTELLAASGIPAPRIAPPVFGPSGTLRDRIEHGAPADILASADMQQPRRLAAERGHLPVLVFARNRMCLLARAALGVTPANMLDRMLDPQLRLVTSTPQADPGGDYAWAVFARAETLHPGAQAALGAKALTLVGGPASQPLVAGHGQVAGVFLAGKGDLMLGYCSSAGAVLRDVKGLVSVPLPPELTVGPAYGMVVLTDHPLAARFAVFVMSEQGQAILARNGFVAIAEAGAAAGAEAGAVAGAEAGDGQQHR
jgi:ABC-type molybdate transport system substrate-binding protein